MYYQSVKLAFIYSGEEHIIKCDLIINGFVF
jgi:hypothetical protein